MNATRTVDALGALAHEHRLAIFRLLVEQGPDGLPAGAIAGRVGRQLFYAADFAAMNGLVDYLTRNCCGGKQSCAPACKPVRVGRAKSAAKLAARSRAKRAA